MRYALAHRAADPALRATLRLLLPCILLTGASACQTTGATPASKASTLPQLTPSEGLPGATVGAARITQRDQLIGGPSATARVGDYLLYNEKIRVVISDVGHGGGVAASGGNIIDVDLARGGHDELGEVFTYLDNTFPRQLIYEQIVVTATGDDGGPAQISAIGRDSMNPEIVGITHYSLAPYESQVKIVTQLTNTGATEITEYELGDALQWGRTHAFAPGYGTDLAGKHTQGPWVAGLGEGVSYGWTAMGVTLTGPHGNGWTDVIVGKVDIPPTATATWERYLTVGSGDIASLLPAIFTIRGELSEKIAGTVVEAGTDYRIPGAVVEAHFARSGRPYAMAEADARGVFQMLLPPDEYELTVQHPSRQSLGSHRVDLIHGEPAPERLEMSAPGKLRFTVLSEGGQALPSKISIVGEGDTPTPVLGPKYATAGALNYVLSLTGQGEIEIPPGAYTLTASRGVEYGIVQQSVQVEGGQTVSFDATLPHEVDTRGYLAADLHQSSLLSPDCSVTLTDAVIANLAEGVEVMVGADDNAIPDYKSALQSLGVEADLKVITGVSIVIPEIGSVTAFPYSGTPSAPAGGAPQLEGKGPQAILEALSGSGDAARVVQVNHPREGGTEGYFDLYNLDPSTGTVGDDRMSFGFNAIEVFNGKRLKAASAVLRDWFLLLNQGYTFTAVGSSDSHTTVTQERGYPRTFIGVGNDTPRLVDDAAVVDAIRVQRDVVVTNGPFIRMTANGRAGIGELLTAEGGKIELAIRVEAPRWVQIDRVEIVANGEVIRTLEATDPDGIVKLDTTEAFAVPRDTWFVVVARGSRGMDPVVPQYKGTTITPLGFTNPIWADIDGDGAFTPLFPATDGGHGYVDVPLTRAEAPR